MKYARWTIVLIVASIVVTSIGCDSFRRKFVRKHKHEEPQEEMIVAPYDYSKEQLPPQEAYQQYFTYWKAWHGELISALQDAKSKKRIVSCFTQLLLNLDRMNDMLGDEAKKKELVGYSVKVNALKAKVEGSELTMIPIHTIQEEVESLMRQIHREFHFAKIKKFIRS